jgi:putative hydrolase of the HAD superfamily
MFKPKINRSIRSSFIRITKLSSIRTMSGTEAADSSSREKILIFDLDGTLYPAGAGFEHHTRENMFQFMLAKGMAPSLQAAEALWRPLFQKYNQSYKGLISGGFEFDRDEYWRAFRAGPELFMSADAGLAETLALLPHKKVIFTNCREREAREVLVLLGVAHMFDAVYGADFMGACCKPEKESFLKVFEHLKVSGKQLYFFEDSVKNLRTGRELGMTTVLIDGLTAREEARGAEGSEGADGAAAAAGSGSGSGSAEGAGGSSVNTDTDTHTHSHSGDTHTDTHRHTQPFIDAVVGTLSDGGQALRAALPELFQGGKA